MSDLVCPECGHGEFHADHHATVRRAYTFGASGYLNHGDEEVIDLDRDVDLFTCSNCGHEVQGSDDLVTEDVYNDVALDEYERAGEILDTELSI